MSEPRGGADGIDVPAAGMGPVLPPSRFGAGYTVGQHASEPAAAAPSTPSSSVGDFGSHGPYHFAANPPPGAYGALPASGPPTPAHVPAAGSSPWAPPAARRRSGTVLVLVAACLLAGGAFSVGRLTAPKPAGPLAAAADVSNAGQPPMVGASTTTSMTSSSAGLNLTDPSGDAVPHPTKDGKVYGPSDIANLSVRSEGANLVVTTVYTASTPMNLVAGATRIRLNPDMVPSCKDSVLDSFDWSIDYDNGGVEVYKPAANCGDTYQPTPITGTASVTGSTVTIKVNQNSLGIRTGQRIVIRGCVSTRIDSSYTTFIQDWAPDSPSGVTGSV